MNQVGTLSAALTTFPSWSPLRRVRSHLVGGMRKDACMFRLPLRSVVLIVALITMLTGLGPVAAQDATPPSAPASGTPEAATFRGLAAGSIEVLAPSTANVVLGRIVLDPGASVPFDPADPSALLVYVTSGEMTFRVEVPISVVRSARGGTPVASGPEEIAAGTEFTLGNGDSAIFPGAMTGEVRNEGVEEASALAVDIVHITEAAGTPTP